VTGKKVTTLAKPLKAPTPADGKFHLIKSAYATNSLTAAVVSEQITDDDKFLIEKHVAWLGRGNISVGRQNKIAFHLVGARRFIGEFRSNTFDDLIGGINRLKNDEVMTIATAGRPAHPYKQNTKRDFVSIIKKFYLWMVKNNYSSILKDDIEEIKVPADDTMTKTAAQMFDEEEILAMISACESSMERAMIATLYEGALRIKELGTLTWGVASFTEENVVINVNVKTNKPRRIPLYSAKPYLAAWKADYPYPIEANSLVFVNALHHNFNHATITKRIRTIAKRAGVTKKITAHIFRHSRITHMQRNGFSEQLIKIVAWANQNTKMLATYSHLCDADVDKEMAAKYGITNQNKIEEHVMNPRQCAHCGNVNSPTANFCGVCGLPLTAEAALTTEQLATELQNTALYKQIMADVQKKLMINPVATG
jgi:site-specific recombinase XerD